MRIRGDVRGRPFRPSVGATEFVIGSHGGTQRHGTARASIGSDGRLAGRRQKRSALRTRGRPRCDAANPASGNGGPSRPRKFRSAGVSRIWAARPFSPACPADPCGCAESVRRPSRQAKDLRAWTGPTVMPRFPRRRCSGQRCDRVGCRSALSLGIERLDRRSEATSRSGSVRPRSRNTKRDAFWDMARINIAIEGRGDRATSGDRSLCASNL